MDLLIKLLFAFCSDWLKLCSHLTYSHDSSLGHSLTLFARIPKLVISIQSLSFLFFVAWKFLDFREFLLNLYVRKHKQSGK